jgi:hypothetical protein
MALSTMYISDCQEKSFSYASKPYYTVEGSCMYVEVSHPTMIPGFHMGGVAGHYYVFQSNYHTIGIIHVYT